MPSKHRQRRRRPRLPDCLCWVNALVTGGVAMLVLSRNRGSPDSVRHRGLFFRGLVSAAEIADETDREAGGIIVPLTFAGFQYTANVSISQGSSTLHRDLVVDTMTDILGVRDCGRNATDLRTRSFATTSNTEESGDGDATDPVAGCITVQEVGQRIREDSWNCPSKEMDYGRLCFCEDQCLCEGAQLVQVDREVTLSGADGTTAVSSTERVTVLPNVSIESESTLDGWLQSDGVLGLATYAGPSRSCPTETDDDGRLSVFGELLEKLPAEERRLFALDLGNASYSSTLEIGGYSGTTESVVWGQSYPAQKPNSWIFSAFDVRACGASLNNVSSSWPAVISTGTACLGLPDEMFTTLMAWIQITGLPCNKAGDETGQTCYVSNTTALTDLPLLSFRLSEYGKRMYIPLSSLLIDEGPGGNGEPGDRRLCVTMQNSMYGSGLTFNLPKDQAYVSIGTLALRSLYVVVDVDAGKVGLAQKDPELNPLAGDENCKPAAVCIGSEAFEESRNACSAPLCPSYFFSRLDTNTMTCRAPNGLRVLAWVVGIGFALVELAGYFLRVYYGGTGSSLRGHRHHQGWEFYTGKFLEHCLAKATGSTARGSNADHRVD